MAVAVVLPSDIAGHDQVMGCQAEHPMPNLFSTDTVRDASPTQAKVTTKATTETRPQRHILPKNLRSAVKH